MGVLVRAGAVGISLLLLAACQGKGDEDTMHAADGGPAKVSAAQLPSAAPTDAPAPPGAGGVDTALAAARAYNERAAKELVAIDRYDAQIRAAATRAIEASRGVDGVTEAQRQPLISRVSAARRDAEQARNQVVDGQARLRKDIDEQVTALEAMIETCSNDERLQAYAGCVALDAEHETLLKNIDALTARYSAADVAYGAERAKLEEASAAVALASLR